MTNKGTGSKKTCLTCEKYDGNVCKIDGFIMGSRDCSCEMYKERPHSSDSEKQSAQQAITDKERREIASNLRRMRKEMDNEKPPQIPTLAAAVYLLRIAKAVKCGASGALFYRLADLIDRRTCQMINNGDYMPSHVFRRKACTSCGAIHWEQPNDRLAFRYCPCCGAEVVTDDE